MRKKLKQFGGGDSWEKNRFLGNGFCTATCDGKKVYLWNCIWPEGGTMGIGGYTAAPKRIYLLKDGTPIDYEFKGHRIILKKLPKDIPDEICGVSVIVMEFDELPPCMFASYYPQLHKEQDFAGENKL